MELFCQRCGMPTNLPTRWAYIVRCHICGHTIYHDTANGHNASIHFPVRDYFADWLSSAHETMSNFLNDTYNHVGTFFSSGPVWSESERRFENNPNNSPPEARARFPRWR
jgi:hypothetical protein